MKMYNFNSGPAMLPNDVLQQAAEAVLQYKNGESIVEISHRSNAYNEILNEAKSLLKELCRLNDDFEILYLPGGASNVFAMIPLNFLSEKKYATFVDTGYWSKKIMNETNLVSHSKVIASSYLSNYNTIPEIVEFDNDAEFLHITHNNTIEGTQFDEIPNAQIPLFADMSSSLLSKEINYNQFDFVYASTHKNAGTAGCTIVFIKKYLLEKINENCPSVFNFKKNVEANSTYSTPSVYAVYISLLMLRWMKKQTLEKIFIQNKLKAELIYKTIDESKIFNNWVAKKYRSPMNVTFNCDEKYQQSFIDFAAKQNITNIIGHRSVGAFRASMYNAMPLAGVEKLVDVIKKFEANNGY
jgi:phosphoserine aminotransferase